jgi:hypothetical protein
VRIRTLVRTSSALPALPLALLLVVLYYASNTSKQIEFWPYAYAPTLVQVPLEPMYAFSYALASGAAAWQGARLKEAGVWQAGAFRRTWQIIALALAPVVALGWLMLVVPVVMAFAETPAWPTVDSLPPLLLGMALVCAHAVIGFSVGRWVKPLIATPVLMCLVFVVVAFPHSFSTMWPRHMVGEYDPQLGFGETATLDSMLAQLLPTAGLAAAVALLWTRLGRPAVRAGLGLVLTAACAATSYVIVRDWDFNPSLNAGKVDVVCAGDSPRVCMPSQGRGDLAAVSADVRATYAALKEYGVVDEIPRTVLDSIIYGRFTPGSAPGTAYLPLSFAYRNHAVADIVVGAAPRFGCQAKPEAEETVNMWLARKLGHTVTYESVTRADPFYTPAEHARIVHTVDEVLGGSVTQQKAWYKRTVKQGCLRRSP